MTPADLEAQLRADIQAFDDAATTADKLAALRAWMVDVSQYLVLSANDSRRLQRQLLIRRVIWNPRLLELLSD